MLNQPYIAPCLTYQKTAVLPKETAYIQKASVLAQKQKGGVRSLAADKFVKQALNEQESRYQDKLSAKQGMI